MAHAAFLVFESSGGASYGIYIPGEAYPQNVITLLDGLRLLPAKFDAQRFATAALVVLSNEKTVTQKPLMMNPLSYEPELTQINHYYRISKGTNDLHVDYTPVEKGAMKSIKGCYGSLTQFKKFILASNVSTKKVNEQTYKNKIVRFYYNGGSEPGYRVVRVESFDGHCFQAIDLRRGEDAHRNYIVGRIKNGLEGVQILS